MLETFSTMALQTERLAELSCATLDQELRICVTVCVTICEMRLAPKLTSGTVRPQKPPFSTIQDPHILATSSQIQYRQLRSLRAQRDCVIGYMYPRER